MLRYFPFLCLAVLLLMSCGGDDDTATTATSADNQHSTTTNNSTANTATDRIETKEQMKELVTYAVDLQKRIFNMPSDKSLSYTLGNNTFNMELYREENGDTLAVVNNGALGKYGEFDRYIFYKDNRPVVMFIDQLQMNVSQQMFTQMYSFYNSAGEVQPTVMMRGDQRKQEMMRKGFITKETGEVHNISTYIDEYKQAVNHTGIYSLFFDEFITEEDRSFLRFKTTNDPASRRYFVTAVRLPEDYKSNDTFTKLERNAQLYQNKQMKIEWEIIKEPTGILVPQLISGEFL